MCGGKDKYKAGEDDDDNEGLKEKLTGIYDFFDWHGVAPLCLLLMFIFCVCCGLYSLNLYWENYSLQKDIERNQITNNHIASVLLDKTNQIIAIDDVYYQGVCELDSIDFDKDGDTCNYWCWWEGSIGEGPRYRLPLPCKAKSK